jgi:hypothetical protein
VTSRSVEGRVEDGRSRLARNVGEQGRIVDDECFRFLGGSIANP